MVVRLKRDDVGTHVVVQRLGFYTPNVGGLGSNSGQATSSHVP